jgi:hypothetical protein
MTTKPGSDGSGLFRVRSIGPRFAGQRLLLVLDVPVRRECLKGADQRRKGRRGGDVLESTQGEIFHVRVTLDVESQRFSDLSPAAE